MILRYPVFFPGMYSCTGMFNSYWKKGECGITGLGKKVVFPKRNGNIIGWLGGIPRGDCKIPLDGWLSCGWWSNGCPVKCLG